MPRKPYPYTVGAYSTPPRLRREDDGRWTAPGQIEQWTGSLADVCTAMEMVLEGAGERCARVSVALNAGTSEHYESLQEFRDALERLDPDDIATIRMDAELPDEGCAVILVRRQRPGVLVEVTGRDRANVLGLAQLVHGRLMTGYEDLGSPRGFIARTKSKGALFLSASSAAVERSSSSADTRTPLASSEGVRSARPPTAVVLWAHGDPHWGNNEKEAWKNTVLGFTHLLRACAIDADLDLFHSNAATDWARFGPTAIRDSDYVLVAVSQSWRQAWDDDIEPHRSAGAVGEVNMLRGLFKENRQRFLERVILVLLPGRGETDLPTELKATSQWERVPMLDEPGIEDLLRRLTGQPAHPTPPLGEPRRLPPRTPATAPAEPRSLDTEEPTESRQEIKKQIGRAESALADMPPASPGSGEKPWVRARDSVEARRKALVRELAQLEAADEQRSFGPADEPAERIETREPVAPLGLATAFERARELARFTHDDMVSEVAFSPDGMQIATASRDRTARVWDIASGREVARLTHDHWVSRVVFSPGGTQITTIGYHGPARVWEIDSGRELARLTHDTAVSRVAFSPDGTQIATVHSDKTARVLDISTRREVVRLTHQDAPWDVAFSPDGTKIATTSSDKTARVWDITSAHEIARVTHDQSLSRLAFNVGETQIAIYSNDKATRVWDISSGRDVAHLTHQDTVSDVAFSPDGTQIATASSDKTARVWDIRTGREVARLTHDAPVVDVTFSPDGTYIATAGEDRTARVCDIASGREVARLTHQDAVVVNVTFSSDGRQIATASGRVQQRGFWATVVQSKPRAEDYGHATVWGID